MNDHTLRIADFDIRLENLSGLPMALESGYSPFIVSGNSDRIPDMTVRCHSNINEELKTNLSLVYVAHQDGHQLWNIAKWEEGLRFMVYLPEAPFTLQQVAVVDSSFRSWDIYSEPFEEVGERGIHPLGYPMGPLLMYYLTIANEAIMIHASGVSDGEKGRIFSGFSGVGKSTMAKIWKGRGATVVNDDRLIIRKSEDGFIIHNTPMFYEDEPRSAALNAVFLPFHSPENTIARLTGSEAVSRLMAYCIQHGYNKAYIEHHLEFLTELCNRVSVHSLGVVPTEEVIDFIRKHEHGA